VLFFSLLSKKNEWKSDVFFPGIFLERDGLLFFFGKSSQAAGVNLFLLFLAFLHSLWQLPLCKRLEDIAIFEAICLP